MAALPRQGELIVPIDWQGETQQTTMQAAGYELSITHGFRPYKEAATLTWVLDKADANTLLNTFKATNFRGVFDYTCPVRGALKVRLNGMYSLQETRGTLKVYLSVGVRTV